MLLDQAYPEGWDHAPYLAMVNRGRVLAWMGWAMAWRLVWLLGPRKAWHIWTLARQRGIFMPPGNNLSQPRGTTRRQFLKEGLTAGLVAVVARLGWPASGTQAGVPCIPCVDCGLTCYLYATCVQHPQPCGDPYKPDPSNMWRCYDNITGEFCGYIYTDRCCDCTCA
jgi:hypothetical protein